MNRAELISACVDPEHLASADLLALRLALNDRDWRVDLVKDIRDLYQFPERLEGSYRDEWAAVVRRGLHQRAFENVGDADQKTDRDRLQAYFAAQQREELPAIRQSHRALFESLAEVEQMLSARNISSLRTPLHQWLKQMLR